MSTHLDLELLRDYADGRLPVDQAREVERVLGQEGPAACEAATYLVVHRVSAPLLVPPETSRLAFDDLELGAPPAWRRPALVAAALLLLGLGAILGARALEDGALEDDLRQDDAREPQRVRLVHVPWSAEVPLPDAMLLAEYRPTALGRVVWLEDASAAQALARASGRPLLRYVQHPDCPMCRALEAGPLRDEALLGALDAVVPWRVDIEHLPRPEIEALMREGWPHLSLLGPAGQVLGAFPGMRPAAEIRDVLERALERALGSAAQARPPPWAELSSTAQAQDRRRRAQAALRKALGAAQAPATHAAAQQARAQLEAERAALGPTPEGEDLARVLSAWPPSGPFPVIEETPR